MLDGLDRAQTFGRDTAWVERDCEDGRLAPSLADGVDVAMMPTEGEKEYVQGVGHFEDFLKNHSILSWGQALNSLQAAVLSPDLGPRKAADANYKLGLLFLFDSNYRDAVYYFETRLRIGPGAFVHEAIGAAYNALHEYERSAWHYGQALELGGNKALSYMGLGRALLEMGRIEEAIDCFTNSASPRATSDAFFWTGNAYRRAGETVRAIESYLAGFAINEEDSDVCQALAETYLEDKADSAAALVWFDRMYELPDSTQAKGLCRTRNALCGVLLRAVSQGVDENSGVRSAVRPSSCGCGSEGETGLRWGRVCDSLYVARCGEGSCYCEVAVACLSSGQNERPVRRRDPAKDDWRGSRVGIPGLRRHGGFAVGLYCELRPMARR